MRRSRPREGRAADLRRRYPRRGPASQCQCPGRSVLPLASLAGSPFGKPWIPPERHGHTPTVLEFHNERLVSDSDSLGRRSFSCRKANLHPSWTPDAQSFCPSSRNGSGRSNSRSSRRRHHRGRAAFERRQHQQLGGCSLDEPSASQLCSSICEVWPEEGDLSLVGAKRKVSSEPDEDAMAETESQRFNKLAGIGTWHTRCSSQRKMRLADVAERA